MRRPIEQYLIPYGCATLISITCIAYGYLCEAVRVPNSLIIGTMTLGMVVAGFASTQRSMLLNMGGTWVLKYTAKTGAYKYILAYLAQCIVSSLLVMIISLLYFFWPFDYLYWQALWVGLLSFLLITMFRNEILMSRLMERFIEEQKATKVSNPHKEPLM